MAGSNDTEVPAIDGGDLAQAQPFSNGDNGRVNCAEWLVGIADHELPVGGLEFDDGQIAVS
jgi:hypothetical protein